MCVEITDIGSCRRVRIRGEAYSFAGYSASGLEFETSYSVELLRELERAKGSAWLKDEIDRAECPDYLEIPLTRFAKRFCATPSDLTALDIGCGVAASSIVLARMGFRVIGIEAIEQFVTAGRLRIRETGFASRIDELWIAGDAPRLPFANEQFGVVVMEAVIEHVQPGYRERLLIEAWRVLRRGGLLVVYDTPNRLWPLDGHTTGLWFATWLPFKMAAAYARAFSRKIPQGTSDEELVSKGLCAPTYWELRRALPSEAQCLNLAGDDVTFAFDLTSQKRRSILKAVLRGLAIQSLQTAGWLLKTLLRVPPTAILQNLNLCFRKP